MQSGPAAAPPNLHPVPAEERAEVSAAASGGSEPAAATRNTHTYTPVRNTAVRVPTHFSFQNSILFQTQISKSLGRFSDHI